MFTYKSNSATQSFRRGSAAVMFAIAITAFMGLLALAVDLGWAYYVKQSALAAAEAAASAGALTAAAATSITCGSTVVCQASTSCSGVASSPVTNVSAACLYGEANGFGSAGHTNLMIASGTGTPPTVSSVSTSFYTTAVAVKQYNGLLSSIMGNTSLTVAARATAALISSVPSQCLWILDKTAQYALNANNDAQVTLNCGIAVDSNNATAVEAVGSAKITSSGMTIVGGYTTNNGGSISPAPSTGAASVADPLGSLSAPSGGACNYTNYSPGYGHWTPSPGVYCGGITINNGATAAFSPGVYYVEGGGVDFGGGATITGTGVIFYLTSNATYAYKSAEIDNGVNVTLSAPSSGTYQGILFFQDRSEPTSAAAASFAGGANMSLAGTLYFPTTAVSFSNGVTSETVNTAIVADTVTFAGGANFKYDSTGASTGLGSKSVSLIE